MPSILVILYTSKPDDGHVVTYFVIGANPGYVFDAVSVTARSSL